MVLNEEAIMSESKQNYKKEVQNKIRLNTFNILKHIQSGYSKISDIWYNTFKAQDYLKSHKLDNHEVSLLFLLR